ncbi:hypothetical protein BAUCODRAFT_336754 [Baudoinia panamericana UAMH 10762]|uniref:Uncharacterized protein n=1 Tax=Baudoinia panamericana (strain UAMH 10762) TaxID=717646 RepID=M2NJ73_BAUPA|nr:uncharacterized protein BAUCODRAFT_336754 [Baudoinia panamericana UAMH 10762]EMC99444.1 hypothetical protein BAUCODRAFT_336754 [Baudoinia panamericana UAMH 10762]
MLQLTRGRSDRRLARWAGLLACSGCRRRCMFLHRRGALTMSGLAKRRGWNGCEGRGDASLMTMEV